MIEKLCVYLGAPEPAWIGRTEVPLFVSYGRLRRLKRKMPRSPQRGGWALDSRGFNELREFGEWTISPKQYVMDVIRYDEEIGNLEWAAGQDWMCEPEILACTGLSIAEHQRRTVDNYCRLLDLYADHGPDRDPPFMLTLQGDPDDPSPDSYHRCWDMYEAAGIDVMNVEVVGLGSVCTRQAAKPIGALIASLQARDKESNLPLHGFGVKTDGLIQYSDHLLSADSQAWSFGARKQDFHYEGCAEGHARCTYCLTWALEWRRRLVIKLDDRTRRLDEPN